jgi:CRISPR system Cascade subunit CasD
MSVLLMRLAGPMQSWGTRSRFSNRDTGLEPSRSGVIGLLCAALGRSREATLEDFLPLKMAVRVDREGRMMRDYHTVGGEVREGSVLGVFKEGRNKGKPRSYGVAKADGSGVGVVVSERFYLANADFLVGLEGDRCFLESLLAALCRPVWPIFLGRKAFVPSLPVAEGISGDELIKAINKVGWRKRYRNDKPPENPLRGVVEVSYGTGEPRPDVPLSFVSRDRRFGVRHVQHYSFPIPAILEPLSESPHVSQQTGSQRP